MIYLLGITKKEKVEDRRRWPRSKTGRSPASPQIHQTLKIWDNYYKATSR